MWTKNARFPLRLRHRRRRRCAPAAWHNRASANGPVASVSIVAVTILPTPGKERRISTSRCSRGSLSVGSAAASRSSKPIDPPFGGESLLVDELQLGHRPRRGAWRRRPLTPGADRQARLPAAPSATSSAVTRRMRCARSTAARRRRESCAQVAGSGVVGQDRPQPGLVRRRTQRQPRGIHAIELIAQADWRAGLRPPADPHATGVTSRS